MKLWSGAPAHPRRRTIRFWLAGLVIACVVPAWGAALLVLVHSYDRERQVLETSTTGTARALIQAVDRELGNVQTALQLLATSPFLGSHDLAGFHPRAQAVVEAAHARNLVLFDASGQQLHNTQKPYGATLPLERPERFRRVFETGRPVVSDLFKGAVSGKPTLAIAVPVFSGDKVAYALAMALTPERLGTLLRGQRLPSDWTASIFDNTGSIVARNHDEEQFIGRKSPAELLRRIGADQEGALETETLDGTPVFATFSRSDLSGWSVAIGIPRAGWSGALQRSMLWTALGAGALFLLALFCAGRISARIGRAIRSLTEPALALASGQPATVPPSGIEEVEEVGAALSRAAATLKERTTQREQAEAAERAMAVEKSAAEQANRAKSHFLTLMSHELRTPLSAILGFAELLDLARHGALAPKQREFVAAILASGNHLLKLINDILDLSKVDTGRLTVSLEDVEVLPLAKSVVANLEQAALKAGIHLEAGDFGLGLPPVHADRVRLAQCLLNLGSNAIKYNRPGGAVTISFAAVGDAHVRFCVTDTGFGIPEARQAELFQPFNRLGAEHRAIEGTGVGLSLTHRLVELMGGRIGFASTSGEGSRFWIDMPISAAPAAHGEVAAASIAGQPVSATDFTVLYVEDNPLNVALMEHLLETVPGANLIAASTARAGLELARSHRPDVIILDIHLSDMNGVALLNELKAMPELAATPVLALSAHAMRRHVKAGLEAGFFRYLTKPLDVNLFLDTLRLALGRDDAAEHASQGQAPGWPADELTFPEITFPELTGRGGDAA
jgi:signal transduction histidine kinase/CheY-like chemotaxis protein